MHNSNMKLTQPLANDHSSHIHSAYVAQLYDKQPDDQGLNDFPLGSINPLRIAKASQIKNKTAQRALNQVQSSYNDDIRDSEEQTEEYFILGRRGTNTSKYAEQIPIQRYTSKVSHNTVASDSYFCPRHPERAIVYY